MRLNHVVAAAIAFTLAAACGSTASTTQSSGTGATSNPRQSLTVGITAVDITIDQALPPPYTPKHVHLTAPAALAAFQQSLTSRHLSYSSTFGPTCTGGTNYTVVISKNSQQTKLTAYVCGGTVEGNVSGDLAGFVADLNSLAALAGT